MRMKRKYPRCCYTSGLSYLIGIRSWSPSRSFYVYNCEMCSRECEFRRCEKQMFRTSEDGDRIGGAIVSGIVKGMDDANKSGEDDDIQ